MHSNLQFEGLNRLSSENKNSNQLRFLTTKFFCVSIKVHYTIYMRTHIRPQLYASFFINVTSYQQQLVTRQQT